MKKCPFCAEQIQDEAIKCRFCMEMLNTGPVDVKLEKELTQWTNSQEGNASWESQATKKEKAIAATGLGSVPQSPPPTSTQGGGVARNPTIQKSYVVDSSATINSLLTQGKTKEALAQSILLRNTILAAVNRTCFADDLASVESAITKLKRIENPTFLDIAVPLFLLIFAVGCISSLFYYEHMTEFIFWVSILGGGCLGAYIGFRGGGPRRRRRY